MVGSRQYLIVCSSTGSDSISQLYLTKLLPEKSYFSFNGKGCRKKLVNNYVQKWAAVAGSKLSQQLTAILSSDASLHSNPPLTAATAHSGLPGFAGSWHKENEQRDHCLQHPPRSAGLGNFPALLMSVSPELHKGILALPAITPSFLLEYADASIKFSHAPHNLTPSPVQCKNTITKYRIKNTADKLHK